MGICGSSRPRDPAGHSLIELGICAAVSHPAGLGPRTSLPEGMPLGEEGD